MAINKISLTLIQNETKVMGFYKCSLGNQDCLHQNDSGNVSTGSVTSRRLAMRIGMPDGSSCIFNGAATASNTIRSSYSCYQGGGLVEMGRFEVRRNY